MTLVMTSLPLGMCFQCLFTIALLSASYDWRKSDSSLDGKQQGNWEWNSNSRDAVASSPSFSCPTARAPRRASSQANARGIKGTTTGTHYIPRFLFCSRYPLFLDLALQAKMYKTRQEIWIIVYSHDRMNRVWIATFKWGWSQVSVGLKSLKGSLRYGDYGLRTTAGRALSFVRSTGLSRANIER